MIMLLMNGLKEGFEIGQVFPALLKDRWQQGFQPSMFGRRPFDSAECFPATRRGDLVLTTTTAADPTGLDGCTLLFETVELLDAVPKNFIKCTTTSFSLLSGDVNDISMPIGNKLMGVLLRSGLFPTAASNNAAFNEVALEFLLRETT